MIWQLVTLAASLRILAKPAVIAATTAYFVGTGPLGVGVATLVYLFS